MPFPLYPLYAGTLPSGEAPPVPTNSMDAAVKAAYPRLDMLLAALHSSSGGLKDADAKVAALEAEKVALSAQLDTERDRAEAGRVRAEQADAKVAALEAEKVALSAQLDTERDRAEAGRVRAEQADAKVAALEAEKVALSAQLDTERDRAEAGRVRAEQGRPRWRRWRRRRWNGPGSCRR